MSDSTEFSKGHNGNIITNFMIGVTIIIVIVILIGTTCNILFTGIQERRQFTPVEYHVVDVIVLALPGNLHYHANVTFQYNVEDYEYISSHLFDLTRGISYSGSVFIANQSYPQGNLLKHCKYKNDDPNIISFAANISKLEIFIFIFAIVAYVVLGALLLFHITSSRKAQYEQLP